jgi:hypothetical protein
VWRNESNWKEKYKLYCHLMLSRKPTKNCRSSPAAVATAKYPPNFNQSGKWIELSILYYSDLPSQSRLSDVFLVLWSNSCFYWLSYLLIGLLFWLGHTYRFHQPPGAAEIEKRWQATRLSWSPGRAEPGILFQHMDGEICIYIIGMDGGPVTIEQ